MVIVPAVIVIARWNIFGDIRYKSLLVADIPVDILPRLEVNAVLCLNIIQDFQNVLAVIHTLWDLTERSLIQFISH